MDQRGRDSEVFDHHFYFRKLDSVLPEETCCASTLRQLWSSELRGGGQMDATPQQNSPLHPPPPLADSFHQSVWPWQLTFDPKATLTALIVRKRTNSLTLPPNTHSTLHSLPLLSFSLSDASKARERLLLNKWIISMTARQQFSRCGFYGALRNYLRPWFKISCSLLQLFGSSFAKGFNNSGGIYTYTYTYIYIFISPSHQTFSFPFSYHTLEPMHNSLTSSFVLFFAPFLTLGKKLYFKNEQTTGIWLSWEGQGAPQRASSSVWRCSWWKVVGPSVLQGSAQILELCSTFIATNSVLSAFRSLCQDRFYLFILHFRSNSWTGGWLHCVNASSGNDPPDAFEVRESENPQVLSTSGRDVFLVPDQKNWAKTPSLLLLLRFVCSHPALTNSSRYSQTVRKG